MGKRPADEDSDGGVVLKNGDRMATSQAGDEAEEYEDDFEDEFESDEEIFEAGVDGRPDAEREEDEKRDAMDIDQKTFIPGRDKLANGESLSPDFSAYELLHTLTATWPCLSFDIVQDDLGNNRKTYPARFYAVAGTQAESGRAKDNQLMVMKLSALSRMEREHMYDSDDDSDEEDIGDPVLETKSLPTGSTTNRVRAHRVEEISSLESPTTLTATMLETSKVLIHDITPHLTSFEVPGTIITPQQSKPLASLAMHRSEGYAIDWSPLTPEGKILTGDNEGRIYITTNADSQWSTDSAPYTGHESSVEDLQWSPNEKNVFASASSDSTVKIWDVRSKSHRPVISVQVSSVDVNVISWSKQTPHLIASGADDGQWACWDLRQWKPLSKAGAVAEAPKPVASFDFHKEQITSVEWHPTDDSIVAIAAGDNTLTLWDLAVELDDEESKNTADAKDVPPQLLFVHYMEQVKECHWHPQIPGMVMGTGGVGFGVFKTISV